MSLSLRKCNTSFCFWVVFLHINIVNFPWEELPGASGGGGQWYPTDRSATQRGTAGFSSTPLQGKEQTLTNPTNSVRVRSPALQPSSFCVALSPAAMLGADRGTGARRGRSAPCPGAAAARGCSAALGCGYGTAPRQGSRHAAVRVPSSRGSASSTVPGPGLAPSHSFPRRLKPRLSTSLLPPPLAPP